MANKSINTQKYATFLANSFVQAVTTGATQLYLAIGRPDEWIDEPNIPDDPTNDTQTVDFAYWRNILGMKRITANDISLVLSRRDWATGTVYDQYDDTVENLFATDFFVADRANSTSYFYVYKCLWNNDGAQSTDSPAINIQGNTSPVSLASDGYTWQYMYRIEPSNEKFLTASWMPVYANAAVSALANTNAGVFPSQVPLLIVSGGVGYDDSNVASISVTIDGDGRDAQIDLASNNFTANSITNLFFVDGGEGYTRVDTINIAQLGVSTQANVRAIIPPYPNHGYDPTRELGASAVMVSVDLIYDEDAKLTTANDYRRIMIVANPLLANGAVANGSFYRQTYDCVLASNTATFLPDDIITLSNVAYPVTAQVVDIVSSNGQYIMRLTDVSDKGRTGLDANTYAFMSGDIVTSNAKSAVLSTISPPELEFFSGQVLYVNHHTTIERAADQIEQFKIVFQFGT